MRQEHKAYVREQVLQRVFQEVVNKAKQDKIPLDNIINDTLYHERNRLRNDKQTKINLEDARYWKKVNKQLLEASEEDCTKILEEVILRFNDEITGNFSERVYKFSTKIMPIFLSVMLNTISPRILLSNFPHLPDIAGNITIGGEVEHLRALQKLGTIILVPTHSSNMDSIIFGWVLYKLGLPAFTYGAGLNLFTNWIISYFMNNLGAYKVDRKKTANLYKQILKEYATITLELGYNNLFFPGGTRSRSGGVEKKLKLGLLGTGIRAYINNLKAQKEKPNLYVVPCTCSYQLVLEAENLSEDFLKETGRSRYIIEDDEFSKLRRIIKFVTSILSLDSQICIHFCPPLDLFGNRVDDKGISYDNRGRPVDIVRYTLINGKVDHQTQRDEEYTRQLGDSILRSYKKNNIVMDTHLLAFTMYKLMQRENKGMDMYRLLRTGGKKNSFSYGEVCEAVETVLMQVNKLVEKNEIRLDKRLVGIKPNQLVDQGLKHFNVYHSKPVLIRKSDQIYPNDRNLVFYYHNRLDNYGVSI